MFTAAQLEDLHVGLPETLDGARALKERSVMHTFTVPEAETQARHGLGRRLAMLGRCVDRVYEVLPPDLEGVPDGDVVDEATAHIQAFVMNAFGACDNLAWIWVLERGVRKANGDPLAPTQIGLGQRYERVQDSLSPALRDLLALRDNWFTHLTGFRDALAHRIPLYIPPFMVDPADSDQYSALDQTATQALFAGDVGTYQARVADRDALRHFKPMMVHALEPPAQPVIFHFQLLADLSTVTELGTAFLDEL